METSRTPEENARRIVRALIWIYFGLLIVEGALRKWIFPGLSNPLLVVRDPVALAIYFVSLRAGVFPRNGWFWSLVFIGLCSAALTYIQLMDYLPPLKITLICGYGVHANFFHLPLIFVMARVLSMEDVRRFGFWTLLILIPMTFIMVAQFEASPDSFINKTAGGEGEMMMAALGKVRTAGPFSFVIGVVLYFSLATSFLIWAILRRGIYKNWLLIASASAWIIGIAVSGSRSAVASCAIVITALAVVFIYRRDAVNRLGQVLLVVVIVGFVITRFKVFQEGLNVLTTRFNEVAEQTQESVARGLFERVLSGITDPAHVYTQAPLLGYGLGIGTNAGANILVGQSAFLLTEDEWSRIFLESGQIFGLAYVLWRISFTVYVGILSIKALRHGNLLPVFVFSAGAVSMFNGQFGQPTILGFAVITFGLTLAAMNTPEAAMMTTVEPEVMPRRIPRGRSAYAERLHGPPAGSSNSNGFHDQ
jgi:hypothetical protein